MPITERQREHLKRARANIKHAGRKKAGHTLSAEKAREILVNSVTSRMKELLEAKYALALGHKKLTTTKLGREIVYTVSPDGTSIEYLFNQAIGKPQESVKHTGEIRTLIVDI